MTYTLMNFYRQYLGAGLKCGTNGEVGYNEKNYLDGFNTARDHFLRDQNAIPSDSDL